MQHGNKPATPNPIKARIIVRIQLPTPNWYLTTEFTTLLQFLH